MTFLYHFNDLFTGKQNKRLEICREYVNRLELYFSCLRINIFVHLYWMLCMIFFCINMYFKKYVCLMLISCSLLFSFSICLSPIWFCTISATLYYAFHVSAFFYTFFQSPIPRSWHNDAKTIRETYSTYPMTTAPSLQELIRSRCQSFLLPQLRNEQRYAYLLNLKREQSRTINVCLLFLALQVCM